MFSGQLTTPDRFSYHTGRERKPFRTGTNDEILELYTCIACSHGLPLSLSQHTHAHTHTWLSEHAKNNNKPRSDIIRTNNKTLTISKPHHNNYWSGGRPIATFTDKAYQCSSMDVIHTQTQVSCIH